MFSSGLPELFGGGEHGSAGGPDVIQENVGDVWVDGNFWIDGIGVCGLRKTSATVGAYLDGVFSTKEKLLDVVMFTSDPGEMFGDEKGVVETTGADMLTNGGERNNDDRGVDFR